MFFAAFRLDKAMVLTMISQGCDPYITNGHGISSWEMLENCGLEKEALQCFKEFREITAKKSQKGTLNTLTERKICCHNTTNSKICLEEKQDAKEEEEEEDD